MPRRSSLSTDGYPAVPAVYPELEGSEQLPVPEGALFLLDLAPGEGYLAVVLLPSPVVSYTAFSPLLTCDAEWQEWILFHPLPA